MKKLLLLFTLVATMSVSAQSQSYEFNKISTSITPKKMKMKGTLTLENGVLRIQMKGSKLMPIALLTKVPNLVKVEDNVYQSTQELEVYGQKVNQSNTITIHEDRLVYMLMNDYTELSTTYYFKN